LQNGKTKNVLVVLFDALSAKHLFYNGYERDTTPNLSRFLEKATVYHNHYSGGNWTTPGTATLLTGTYPWTHRAFSQRDKIIKDKVDHNIFKSFDRYFRIAYSHNSIPVRFFEQFSNSIDYIKPQKDLFTVNNLSLDRIFAWDNDIASLSWDRIIKKGEKEYTYSPLFARLYENYVSGRESELLGSFPRGIPHTGEDDYFLLEDGIDWLKSEIETIPQPFIGYSHFLPPHRPYATRREFVDFFKDDGVGFYIEKPRHPLFSQGNVDKPLNLDYQRRQRQFYDEFILYVDAQFGRLYDSMKQSGLLENTWLVFTSDHGEMFERGIFGHRTPVLYEPVIQIPLVIFAPGQTERQDIYTRTSSVDVLPTLLELTDHPIPSWVEGTVLPPFSGTSPDEDRSIFALEATQSEKYEPLSIATVMLVKGRYKLTYYFGYEELRDIGPLFELFDLEDDPEELKNIYSESPQLARALREELLEKISQVDEPYKKN
jgi:arylsulfatase A-like enzyme